MGRPAKIDKGNVILEFDLEAIKAREREVAKESDEEIILRLRERFQILTDMTKAIKSGSVRALIVSGPPGVGKSFGVEEVLGKDDLFDKLAERKPKYEIVKGASSAIGLYAKLYEFSKKGNVLVFDDCDDILMDELSLNLLKGALDSSKKRWISWNTDSRILRSEGIPDRFEFSGAAIFITNIKFDLVRSKKLRAHLEALESRCHYIDLEMTSVRERILRIKQVVNDGMLDDRENLSDIAKDEVIQFIIDQQDNLREISLRSVLKVADLREAFPSNWQAMARTTVLRRI